MNKLLPNTFKAFFYCFILCFSGNLFAQSPCPFDIKDFEPIPSKDCLYLLQLHDAQANGWDGASLDVSVAENWPATNYKVTVADGECLLIPIYVNDGETIDLAYWNGAFETEHSLTLYDALGEIAVDQNGNDVNFLGDIPSNAPIRVKAECPFSSCEDATEDFTARITMGQFPEEQSWEIYNGNASETGQGDQVFGVNANTYVGLAPGFQLDYNVTLDLCNAYTFVAFDGFNDGWDTGIFEVITANLNYGTEITNPADSHFGESLVLIGTGLNDETRLEFTLPCKPACEDVLITNAVNCEVIDPALPVATPEICYPACGHALGCAITIQQTVIPSGIEDNAITGAAFPYADQTEMVFTGTLPAGAHGLVTSYTYCDGIIVKCTTDLVITGQTNATLTCNDNVLVSLGVPSSTLGEYTLGECVTAITPDMVLEMPNICEDEYEVTILDSNGNPLVVYGANGLPLDASGSQILPGSNQAPANNFVSSAELMETLTYTVRHLSGDNVCWGTISIEDKVGPVLTCVDYDINCTHPEALNENYSHTETYEAAAELPANIAGGTGGVQSNTWIPINIGCTAFGENVKSSNLSISIDHSELSDLQIVLHAPSSVQFFTPVTLATNGQVQAENSFNLRNVLGFTPCEQLASSSPEVFVTENSGAGTPTNLGGTWYIQVIDNDAEFFANPYGGGEVTAASLTFECGFPFPYSAFDCSLEEVNLLSESLEETACDQSDWNGARIVRTWQAIDKYGNSSTCEQTVNLKAPQMDEITKPGDISIECKGQTAADLTLAETGAPTFGCFDLTQDLHGLCDISYSYEDLVVATCGEGFKIIRTWTFINWCSGVNKTHQQIIKVEDTEGPTIVQENITVGTNPYTCAADFTLANLDITDNCSGVSTVTATYSTDGTGYQGGNLVIVDLTNGGAIEGLPLGVNEVEITAKDACLNATTITLIVTVEDRTIPIAVCDDELHVSLGGDGTARLGAEDIDEGSYDNCSDITLEVRRIDGCLGTSAWAAYVPFECCDVDELVTVELKVTDAAGNSNICWKSVLVEDALAPILTCPADKTLECTDAAVHTPFGEAVAIDNCNATVTFVDAGELDQCKAGTLTRTFTAVDNSEKSADATCVQRVTVEHVSDFVVQFPADVTSNTCDITAAGEPTISGDDCEVIAISSEDVVYTIDANACFKIERTWTIINWCVYDAGNPANTNLGFPQPLPRTYQDDDGYFSYVQTIEVSDNVAPVLECPTDLTFCDLTDGCEGQADLTIVATDNCSNTDVLEYTFQIDADNNGSFDIVSTGSDASGVYPYGTHRIKWIVEDGCGNTSACEYLFTIEDCKNPTPVCLNGISIPAMEASGCVDIWASDVLQYAFDNCTDDATVTASAKIRREGDTAAPTSSLTLCCADEGTVIIEVWVEDEVGNADYCTTYVILQDNGNVCDASKVSVAGTVKNQNGENVENVLMELDGNGIATDATGTFVFPNMDANANYAVTASKDMNPTNGVSTYDLVLMSQHILGLNEFTSPYTMIAADVNNDGVISTFDVVQTRQLILYVVTDFPSNTSWRFVDADYVFPNQANPWMETFPEAITLNNLSQDELAADFVGVKIGDVDGNATPNSLVVADERSNGTLVLSVDDAVYTKGENMTIDFRASDFNEMNGFQFTLNFDATGMTFANVEAGALNVSDANFGFTMLNEGVITTSWNNNTAKSVNNDEILFSMNFTATAAINLSDALTISSRYTTAEAYNTTELMEVALAFNTTNGTIVNGGAFELYQNTPNPFSTSTLVSFNLPTASTATLNVYDAAGRTLKVVSGDFAKGYNQITLEKAELNATGVLYYELSTATNAATMKMIILE